MNLTDDQLDQALTDALRGLRMDDFTALAAESDRREAERERRLSASNALADGALWYAAQGVPVFPLRPGEKIPLAGSRGFKDATTDPATVRGWWARVPQANIGLPTGGRFDVIDVDGPAGYQSMADLQDRDALPEVIGKAYTPRGGRHLYVPPTGDGNAARFLPGLDYRGAGGYILAPPSVGTNGKRYDWIIPLALGAAG